MALLFTILMMVGVLCVGYYLFEHSEEDRNDTWRRWR